jgi:hypothetical protein
MVPTTARCCKEKDRQAAVLFASGNRLIPAPGVPRGALAYRSRFAPAVLENG